MQTRAPVSHLYPPGTCKAPEFYFRGSKLYGEPEYLTEQLSDALKAFKQARQENKREKLEYEKVSKELEDRENYTLALASALGEGSSTEENAALRKELAELTVELEEVQKEISFYQSEQNISALQTLQREHTFYHAEIENLKLELNGAIENLENRKKELGRNVISVELSRGLLNRAEVKAMRQLKQQLKDDIHGMFERFSNAKSKTKSVRQRQTENAELKQALESKHELIMQIDDLRRKENYLRNLSSMSLSALIDQIEAMNRVLVSFGGEQIDCDDLRRQFQESQQEDENPEKSHQPTAQVRPRSSAESPRKGRKVSISRTRKSVSSLGSRN